MEKKELNRTKQCAKCPWKVSTDPYEIPNNYDVEKHEKLECTIAKNQQFGGTLKAMACHESKDGEEDYCIGWLHNQLGEGNNVGLRIKMLYYSNVREIQVFGKQHKKFRDTLPKRK